MTNSEGRGDNGRNRSLLSLRNGAEPAATDEDVPSWPRSRRDERLLRSHGVLPATPYNQARAERSEQKPAVRRLWDRLRAIDFPKTASSENARTVQAPAEDKASTAARAEEPQPAATKPAAAEPASVEPLPPRPEYASPYWQPLIDPAKVIGGIGRSRWIIVAMTILGAVAGVLVALATPKEYYAATELLVDPRDIQIIERDLTRGGLPSDATLALVENQVRVITSGAVLNKVVDRLDLEDDPEFNGAGEGGLLSVLSNPRSLFSFGEGDSDVSVRRALAVGNLAESLDVERDANTFVIMIGVTTREREKSALIANTVAQAFLETYGELQSATASRANDEITNQLDELRESVEKAERAVADYKAKFDIVDAQGRLISEDEIVRLNDQLAVARARTAELKARAASARDIDVGSILGGALPEQVASPVLTELRAQYASLKQQADRLSVRLGPRHPDRLSLEAQLAGARAGIERELDRVVASLQVELQRAVRTEQDLAERLTRLKAEKGNLENEQVELRELEREAAARRAVYEAFLIRARETGQQQSLNTANISIISEAYPPLLPSGASRASIAIAGMLLGLLAGIGIGAARGAVQSFRQNTRQGQTSLATGEPNGPPEPPPGSRQRPPQSLDQSDMTDAQTRSWRAPRHVAEPVESDPLWRRGEDEGEHPVSVRSFSPDEREADISALAELRDTVRAFRRDVEEMARQQAGRRHG